MKTGLQALQAPGMVQEHQPTVWMSSGRLQSTHTVEFPTDRFSKTDPEPICADRSRSVISAIVFRLVSWSSGSHIIQWRQPSQSGLERITDGSV